MPDDTRNSDQSQPYDAIQAHFDLVKITIKDLPSPGTKPIEVLQRLVQSFASRFLPPGRRLPRIYYDNEQYGGLRIDFDFACSRVTILAPGEYTGGTIIISNTNRNRPHEHHQMILQIGDWLSACYHLYVVSIAEIAIDARSLDAGQSLVTCVLPSWGQPQRLFNYGSGSYREGGSCDGFEEYMFRGRPMWVITEHGTGYRKQPRRQFHAYVKHPGIWRYELRFFRSYLWSQSINTVEDLFRAAPDLINRNLHFRRLNMRKLRREHPSSRNWGLTGKSVPEQLRIIMERLRRSRRYADRFFERLDPPHIDLSLFQTEPPRTPLY